jgi:hypothetical protein
MMPPSVHRPRWPIAAAALAAALAAVETRGIEMFTYFGDGSRIGLPNLEVPIEAYPGIPLRSDRLRARRRAQRLGPNAAVGIGPPGYARGITIRAMPTMPQPQPGLIDRTTAAPRSGPESEPPMAPEPAPASDESSAEASAEAPEKARGEAEMIPAPAPER